MRGCSANSRSQENVCVRDEQQNCEVPKLESAWTDRKPVVHERGVCECFSLSWEGTNCLREWSQLWWSVCVGEDLQSCHPTPKYHNCLNHQQPFLMKVVGIKQGKKTHGHFYPIGQGLTIPHILILGKFMPLFNLVAAIVVGRVHLINYRCIFTWCQT